MKIAGPSANNFSLSPHRCDPVTIPKLQALMRTFSSRISLDAAKDACTTGVAYFLCASLTLHFTRFDNGIAIVWLAGALLFAKLCATPHRRWPLLILACLPAALASGLLFGIAGIGTLSLPCVALTEACVAAWMVKRAFPRFGRFQSVPEASAFLLIAGIMVPAAGASLSA